MDKLDNETWEEYALRHNLFKIKYTDADNSIIDDIYIPDYKIEINLLKFSYGI